MPLWQISPRLSFSSLLSPLPVSTLSLRFSFPLLCVVLCFYSFCLQQLPLVHCAGGGWGRALGYNGAL